jgi:hypothetical protein
MTLANFVLVGTIISSDPFLSTVEFNLNPATNGGPAIAVLPNEAIPCKIEIGKKIYVVKDDHNDVPIITCEKAGKSESG